LEDHAVHGAAAPGGAVARVRGPAQGGAGGRRDGVATLHQSHAAGHEAGHPRCAAVPYARRVPRLRQHLHPDPGQPRHAVGVHPELRPAVHHVQPRSGLSHVDTHLPDGRPHRVRLHQGIRRCRAGTGAALMAVAAAQAPGRSKAGWLTANTIVILAAAVPIWWLIALSFKDPSTILSGSFWPTKWTLSNSTG